MGQGVDASLVLSMAVVIDEIHDEENPAEGHVSLKPTRNHPYKVLRKMVGNHKQNYFHHSGHFGAEGNVDQARQNV